MKTRAVAEQFDLPFRPERKRRPAVWLRRLKCGSHWYIRVRLAKRMVIRLAGGAVTKEGAEAFLAAFKAEFQRTGKIPRGLRHPRQAEDHSATSPVLSDPALL